VTKFYYFIRIDNSALKFVWLLAGAVTIDLSLTGRNGNRLMGTAKTSLKYPGNRHRTGTERAALELP